MRRASVLGAGVALAWQPTATIAQTQVSFARVSWHDALRPASHAAGSALAIANAELLRLEFLRYRASESAVEARSLQLGFQTLREQYEAITVDVPDSIGAWFGLARALDALDDATRASGALDEARRRVGDGPELADVLFQQGVEFTRLLRFAAARDSYIRYGALPLPDYARGTALCNLAEVETYLGESDASIADYRRGVELRPDDAGGFWGLASAYDHSGRDVEARGAAATALEMDPELSRLVGPGVFFVPAHEIYYYLGLASEARGRSDAALEAWETYLARGGAGDPCAARVRTHIRRLHAAGHRRSIAPP